MANGTIAFDTLQTSGQISGTARSLDTDYIVRGSNKSFAIFQMDGTAAISNSFNTTSLTDNGTGNFTLSHTNNFSSIAYGHTGDVCFDSSATTVIFNIEGADGVAEATVYQTSSFNGESAYVNNLNARTNSDTPRINIEFFGDIT